MGDYTTKNLLDTLVYWGTPSRKGIVVTFAEPTEINGRWVDKAEMYKDNEGREQLSQAVVLVDQDVDVGGYLMKGDLTYLPSDDSAPHEDEDAYEIKQFQKATNIRGTKTVRKVWL